MLLFAAVIMNKDEYIITSLIVHRTWLSTVGDRAFPVAAARVWNKLPCTPHYMLHRPSTSFLQSTAQWSDCPNKYVRAVGGVGSFQKWYGSGSRCRRKWGGVFQSPHDLGFLEASPSGSVGAKRQP